MLLEESDTTGARVSPMETSAQTHSSPAVLELVRDERGPELSLCVPNSKTPSLTAKLNAPSDAIAAPILAFLAWLILLVLCWPLALLALVLYPHVGLIRLPFRLAGIAVHAALELVRAVIMPPVRIVRLRRA